MYLIILWLLGLLVRTNYGGVKLVRVKIYLTLVLNPVPSIQTQVIVFHPTGLSEPSKQGYCWSSSLDVLRPDAWRCMDTNQYNMIHASAL
jgi:hypothetical protein